MKAIRFIQILFKKRISEGDLVDLWLIAYFRVTLSEMEPIYKDDTRQFYADHQVSNFQYELWRSIAFFKVRRYGSYWFWERRFPWFSHYLPSRKYTKKGFMWIELNTAPSVKNEYK